MSKLENRIREIEEEIFKSKSLTDKLSKKITSHPLVDEFGVFEFMRMGTYHLYFKPLVPWIKDLKCEVHSYATPGWDGKFTDGIFLEPSISGNSEEFDKYFPEGDGGGMIGPSFGENVRIGTDTVDIREYLEHFDRERTKKMYDELFLLPVKEKKLESIKNVDDYIDWYYGQIDKVITTLKKSLKLIKEVAIDNPMFNKDGELMDYARGGSFEKEKGQMYTFPRYSKYKGMSFGDEAAILYGGDEEVRHQEARDWMEEMEEKYSGVKFKRLSLDEWLSEYRGDISAKDHEDGYMLAYGEIYAKGGELMDADTEFEYARGGKTGLKIVTVDRDPRIPMEDIEKMYNLKIIKSSDADFPEYDYDVLVGKEKDIKGFFEDYNIGDHMYGEIDDYAKGGYIDVEVPKGNFRINRMYGLDDKQKHPKRNYYASDDGNSVYYIEDGYLYEEVIDENGNFRSKSFRPSKTTIKYGTYAKGGELMDSDTQVDYAKGGRLSIAEIKRRTQETNPYFFDKKTMKDFGQRMSDFKVTAMEDGRYKVSAPTYSTDFRTGERKRMKDTVRYFNPKNNELERVNEYAKGGNVNNKVDTISNWVMFCYNYPSNFMDAFGEKDNPMRKHLTTKFESFYDRVGPGEVMNKFYVNLDNKNRTKLVNWVKQNYKGQ